MKDHMIEEAQHPNHSTGPNVVSDSSTTTEEGNRVCRLNAVRHEITGQLVVFTPPEHQAYDKHCKMILDFLLPVGDFERDTAQSIADDRWRLKRARSIEASLFALGMAEHSAADTGQPDVDDALAQAKTWRADAHNLHLLTIYEQRIQRAMDKNTAYFKTLQAERKEAAKEAMRQAKLLLQLAQAEGKPYRPESYFITAPETRESVFSTAEVAREMDRVNLLDRAEAHSFSVWRGDKKSPAGPSKPLPKPVTSKAPATGAQNPPPGNVWPPS